MVDGDEGRICRPGRGARRGAQRRGPMVGSPPTCSTLLGFGQRRSPYLLSAEPSSYRWGLGSRSQPTGGMGAAGLDLIMVVWL
jgi:hypothetical protein